MSFAEFLSNFWPTVTVALVVAVVAAFASRHAIEVLPEHDVGRALYVGTMGAGIVGAAALVLVFFGVPVNVISGLTVALGVFLLFGFAKMTERSRAFERLTKALLEAEPAARAARASALLSWLEAGSRQSDNYEHGAELAECALALIAAGEYERARERLDALASDAAVSSAERARLVGVRALLARLSGKMGETESAFHKERQAPQDFMSGKHLRAYEALELALAGFGEQALTLLGHRARTPGDSPVARWARVHALAASGQEAEALACLRSELGRHGTAAIRALVNVRGPASRFAEALLDQARSRDR